MKGYNSFRDAVQHLLVDIADKLDPGNVQAKGLTYEESVVSSLERIAKNIDAEKFRELPKAFQPYKEKIPDVVAEPEVVSAEVEEPVEEQTKKSSTKKSRKG